MARRLANHISGIAPFTNALSRAGVTTSDELIEACADSDTRARVCEVANVSGQQMEVWFHKADLARIDGLTPQFIELLAHVGVHAASDLVDRDPATLTAQLVEANVVDHVCPRPPALSDVEEWIEQARELPRITYH